VTETPVNYLPPANFQPAGYPVWPVDDGNRSVVDPTGTGAYGNLYVQNGVYAPIIGGLMPSGDQTGITDQAQIQALYNLGFTSVTLAAGQFYTASTITQPWNAVTQGAGCNTQINFKGNGEPCLLISNPTVPSGNYATQEVQSGGVRDLLIDGTDAGSGSTGLQIGNGLGYIVTNLLVRNFTGTESIGVRINNNVSWTEKCYFRTTVANCTNCYVFTWETATDSSGSLEYSWYDMVAYWTSGQNGWYAQNQSGSDQIFWGGAHLYWRGNCNGTTPGPFLSMEGGILFKRCFLEWCPENNGTSGAPQTIFDNGGGTNQFVNCNGWIDFGANTWAATNLSAGNFGFAGSVEGDTTLQALRTAISKPTVTTPSVPAASTNYTNAFGIGCFAYISGGTGVTVSINGGTTGLSGGTFFVDAGQTISLGAYTVAPTWAWHVGPYP
jgi:hypothetical protein